MDLLPDYINIFKECFKNISVKDLNDRINFFRNYIDLRRISEDNLKKELRKLFSVNLHGESVFFFLKSDLYTDQHSSMNFYRIRKFNDEDYKGIFKKSFPSMQKEQHAWLRSKQDVSNYGRIHRPNQSILYTSSQVVNAIYETNCQIGEFFFLLVYENIERMRIAHIHNNPYMDRFTEVENAKLIILHNFLLSEFSKIVPIGREYLYKTSLAIYEEFFFDELIDGFQYPSIRSECKMGDNVGFTEDQAKNNLKFLGAMVCELAVPKDDSEFGIELYYDGFLNDDDSFTFYPYNSEISKIKFGDFTFKREMGL